MWTAGDALGSSGLRKGVGGGTGVGHEYGKGQCARCQDAVQGAFDPMYGPVLLRVRCAGKGAVLRSEAPSPSPLASRVRSAGSTHSTTASRTRMAPGGIAELNSTGRSSMHPTWTCSS